MDNNTPSAVIAELSGEHAVLAMSLVLGTCDVDESLSAWSKKVRDFTPMEFLLLWNEAQLRVASTLGPESLLSRVELCTNKRIRVEYVRLHDQAALVASPKNKLTKVSGVCATTGAYFARA